MFLRIAYLWDKGASLKLQHLRTLIAVEDTGSFHTAAERVFITQSAVSMQMKELEDSLQLKIFDRTQRPHLLTATGHLLVDRAREIVRLCDGFLEAVPMAGNIFGLLRLGAIPGVTTGLLPETLDNLRRQHPKLQFTVQTGLSAGLALEVAQGALDAAIITEPPRLEPNLACRTIHSERLVVVAHKKLAGKSEQELLEKGPFVYYTRRSNLGRLIDAALIVRRIAHRPLMELDSVQAILKMVSLGFGISIVPERGITPAFRPKVYCVPFGAPPLVRRLGLVIRQTHHDSPLVNALHTELRNVSSRWQAFIPSKRRRHAIKGKR